MELSKNTPLLLKRDETLSLRQQQYQILYLVKVWWAWEDLNFRPHAYQACALTN